MLKWGPAHNRPNNVARINSNTGSPASAVRPAEARSTAGPGEPIFELIWRELIQIRGPWLRGGKKWTKSTRKI
jgi:hypothetical protein